MRKLLAILFFAFACSAPAASLQIIRGTITVTNAPTTNGQSLTVLFVAGSTQRIWTNDPSGNPAIFIQTNSAIAASATNLWDHLAAHTIYPSYGIDPKYSLGSNAVTIVSSPGGGLTLSVTGFWASVSYATQLVATPLTMPVRVPITVEASSNQTYIASTLVQNLSDLSTNSFATNSTALANYVSASPVAQSFGNKTITNGIGSGIRLTNIVGLNGTVFILTNGIYTNAFLDKATATNLVNYGNAISSPGTGANSDQFGTGALATNTSAFAAGRTSIAGGIASTALGMNAQALGDSSTSLGQDSSATASGASVVGQDSHATAARAGVFGNASQATHADSVVIGSAVSSSTNAEITLGTTSYTVNAPGRLITGSITNSTLTGTNINSGSIRYPRASNATLVNGNNPGILLGTNVYITLTGPTTVSELAGFVAQPDGTYHIVQLRGAITNWVVNYTGSTRGTDGTAANRIETGNPASGSPAIDISMTNNPSWMEIIYDGAVSRWQVISHSN